MGSLRWKLVLLYAAILTAVIAGFSVVLVLRLERALVEAADRECESRARAVAAALDTEAGRWHLDPEGGLEPEFAPDRGVYFAVSSREGRLLLASPLASTLGIEAAPATGSRDLEAGDKRYRELTVSILKPGDPEDQRPDADLLVACGKDMQAARFSVSSLVRQLVVIGPLVLIASLAGGLFLVSRTLRPIDRMARTAAAISATDLSKRIEISGTDELARLGATLNDTFDRLQASFERQTRFTANASHELRTPLSVISGNVELALKRERSAEEYREILADVQDATQRMNAIVEGLLTLARADAGAKPAARRRVDLPALVGEVVQLHRPLADEYGVSVSVESARDVAVMGDPEGITELVTNLLTNAIRYNRPGGKVTIRVSAERDRARIAVEDTGIGIADEHLSHIFDRFYRVEQERPRDGAGSGLGLAIARSIAEAHAGTIQVASRKGIGTTFLVGLPAI